MLCSLSSCTLPFRVADSDQKIIARAFEEAGFRAAAEIECAEYGFLNTSVLDARLRRIAKDIITFITSGLCTYAIAI